MNEVSAMSSQYDPRRVAELLTLERLAEHLNQARGDHQLAVERYQWSCNLSMALFSDIGLIEVAFRNAVDQALRQRFGRDHWYWDPQTGDYLTFLDNERAKRNLRSATKKVDRHSPVDQLPAGKVVAELMLGFWVHIVSGAPSYAKRLWLPDNTAVGIATNFQGLKRKNERGKVHRPADLMRATRNRIAHHEPILGGVKRPGTADLVPLDDVVQEIQDLARLIDPSLHELLRDSSTFSDLRRIEPK